MTATQLQLSLELSDDAKLVQVYGEDEFSTVVDNDLIYLLRTTKISKYNVIASVDAKLNCKIFDRDKANLFIDWSHEHYGKAGKIEDLSDEQIEYYISNYLEPDTVELLTFKPMDAYKDNDFYKVVVQCNPDVQNEIFTSLCKLGVYAIPDVYYAPVTITYTQLQSDYLENKMYAFCKMNSAKNKYATCSRQDNGKYIVHGCNGTVGKIKKMSNQLEHIAIFFDKLPSTLANTSKIEQAVKRDVEGSSYHVANRFIKLQSALDKAINKEVERIQNIKGHIDLANVNYPDLEVHAEQIAKLIRKYKNTNMLDVKQNITKELINVYVDAVKEIQKTVSSIKALNEIK